MKDKELRKLMDERQVFIDKREAYYDKFTDEELGSDNFNDLVENSRCEELRIEILDLIEEYHEELSVENIFEGLTSVGAAPSLLYDDDGNFAIGVEGMQNIVSLESKKDGDDLDFRGTWFLKKGDWKPTVREAIAAHFERYKK